MLMKKNSIRCYDYVKEQINVITVSEKGNENHTYYATTRFYLCRGCACS